MREPPGGCRTVPVKRSGVCQLSRSCSQPRAWARDAVGRSKSHTHRRMGWGCRQQRGAKNHLPPCAGGRLWAGCVRVRRDPRPRKADRR